MKSFQNSDYFEQEQGFRPCDHPVVTFFARQRLSYLRGILDLERIPRVLDVGCGSGFSDHFLRREAPFVVALDYSPTMISRHPRVSDGTLLRADASHLPFCDLCFDLVYAWEVLHHLPDPQTAVEEMGRVSRRYVCIAEPNPLNPVQFAFALADREHRGVLHQTLPRLHGYFQGTGLKVIHSGQGGLIFPNKTPVWLWKLLKPLPYILPLVGITNWLLAEKAGG